MEKLLSFTKTVVNRADKTCLHVFADSDQGDVFIV